jgi:hypothetical protein
MDLREDFNLHGFGPTKLVLLCENGSFSMRLLQDTFVTPHIPLAEADLVRLVESEMETYDVWEGNTRIAVGTGQILVLFGDHNLAMAWGDRQPFNRKLRQFLTRLGLNLSYCLTT